MRNRLLDNKGFAMIVVVGTMLVLSALALGLTAVVINDLVLSAREMDSVKALHVAEAGIQKALWQLETQGNNMEPKNFTLVSADGTATVSSLQGIHDWLWGILSVGQSGPITRKIKVTVYNFSLWNMNMSISEAPDPQSLPAGGNGINGTTSVTGPFYVRGTVQLSGNSFIEKGPLFIKEGSLKFMDGSSKVGRPVDGDTSNDPDWIEVYVEPYGDNLAISDQHGDPVSPYPDSNQLYASKVSNRVPNLQLPELDENWVYRNRAGSESTETAVLTSYPGIYSMSPVTEGGYYVAGYKVIDNNTIDNQSMEVKLSELSSGSEQPSFGLEPPASDREFGWDSVNKVIFLKGTTYVDGDLYLGGKFSSQGVYSADKNKVLKYQGNGTLVVNGDVYIGSNLEPIGGFPNPHVMGLVVFGNINILMSGDNANPTQADPDISGAYYTKNEIVFEANNISFMGSMIAGVLNFGGASRNAHLFTHPQLPNYLPPTLPGSTQFLTATTAWREVP